MSHVEQQEVQAVDKCDNTGGPNYDKAADQDLCVILWERLAANDTNHSMRIIPLEVIIVTIYDLFSFARCLFCLGRTS